MNEALTMLEHPVAPYVFALAVAWGATTWFSRRHNRRLQKLAVCHSEQIKALKSELNAVLSSAEGMGEKLARLEQRARVLEQRQDQMTLKEPSEQIYSHALRLVRHGEDITTVMERSGISRGEAELLQLLNGLHQNGKGKSAA